MRKKRLVSRRPSPATVIASIALFVALGPSAYATHLVVRSSDVVDGTLRGVDVANGSLEGEDIANRSIRGADIADGSLLGFLELAPSSIGGGRVMDESLSGADVEDESLTGADISDSLTATDVSDDALTGGEIYEPSLATVPSAANAEALGGLSPPAFMRAPTKWKKLVTVGERLPIEIGNPACSGDRDCTASLRCDPGDVLLSGGFNQIDNGTRLMAAFPFNANGYDHKFVLHWHNNSTADTVELNILCADQ